VGGESPLFASSVRRRGRSRSTPLALALAAGVLGLIAVLAGLAFAGSSRELAPGTHVAGIDIGGLTQRQAVATLEQRFSEISDDPVAFVAGVEKFSFAANQLGVEPDWPGAVAAAARAGSGFGPIRGFRRLHTRFFGAEVLPRLSVSNAALEFALDRIATAVDRDPRSASLVRRGLRVEIVPERTGTRLEREAAAQLVVRQLGSLDRGRGTTVTLPVVTAPPPVTSAMLAAPARRARVALSGPVFLRGTGRSWRLPRWRIAQLLSLPSGGSTKLAIAGPLADDYFRALSSRVGKKPLDARFAVSGESIQILPSRDGTELDVPATARALLRAATRPTNRVASLAVARAAPDRTTPEVLAMGIDTRMSTYKTYNSGTYDRITNLRLGVQELDDTLVEPGGTFSLNEAIGERTVERGFRPAPVIIGTKYAEEVGGGTSQVATTVFNAVWEAGLKITERNPHSLYISRYPLGRDATVYWPSLDLSFVNDTEHWVLVKGFPEPDGIRVSIYGGDRRRVESSAGTRTITGSAPVKRVNDPKLPNGKTRIEAEGTAPSRTSVTRSIYGPDGNLIRTETWNTSYKGETRIIRVGTKPEKPAAGDATAPPGQKTKPPAGATPSTPPP
jgi:vancomycin resistance protein YoaR